MSTRTGACFAARTHAIARVANGLPPLGVTYHAYWRSHEKTQTEQRLIGASFDATRTTKTFFKALNYENSSSCSHFRRALGGARGPCSGNAALGGCIEVVQGSRRADVSGRVAGWRGCRDVPAFQPRRSSRVGRMRIPAVSLISPRSCSNGSRMRRLRKSAKSGTDWATEKSSLSTGNWPRPIRRKVNIYH